MKIFLSPKIGYTSVGGSGVCLILEALLMFYTLNTEDWIYKFAKYYLHLDIYLNIILVTIMV